MIAAINGAAVGIGATMTLAMDARLMSTRARFGLVFGRLGITPEAARPGSCPGSSGCRRRSTGATRRRSSTPTQTLEAGLARSVHEPEELLVSARSLADRWTRDRSAVAVALSRQMLYRNAAAPHPVEAHRVDSLAMLYTSIGDGVEGVASFLEKREARFTARASTEMPAFYDEWIDGSGVESGRRDDDGL